MRRSAMMHLLVALALAAFVRPATAQEDDSGPAVGVARISLIDGDVTTRRGVSGDWVEARVNMPLVEGDVLSTGPGSRAEIQLDYSNLIRLDSNTELEVTELGNRLFRVRLLDGRVTYSELRGGEADVDIETPFAAVRPMKNGRYEVQVAQGETAVLVRRGEADVATEQGVERLKKGKMMVLREGPDGLIARETRAEPSRGWDEWNERRDERLLAANSYRYVSRSVVGADDLDYHGDWRYVSGYGHCWYPRGVGAGWAPYRHGRWLWVDYYGWSWVGYEPWGWAPYHYGRWFYHASWGWGWHPGHIYRTHYWRPALVSFFGFGSGGARLGVGFGFGRVGWVPLAPGEAYYPWYGRGGWGRGGVTKIKNSTIIVDNSVNIYNVYRNARAHNGVTVVDAQSFSRGQLNNPQSLRDVELRRASLVRGQIPVVPARESLGRAAARNASAVRGASRASVAPRGVASRGGVRAAAARPSFDQQRDQVARSVREFRTQGERSASSAAASRGGVRAASGSTASGRVVPSTSSGVRAAGGSVRSGASGESARWRRADEGGSSVRSSAPSTGGVRSASRASVRSGDPSDGASLVNRSPSRVDRSSSRAESVSRWPQRSTSRVDGDRGVRSSSRVDRSSSVERSSSRVDRSASPSITWPDRSSSRVDRSSRWPERSSSRVDRSSSGDSGSRVDRGSARTQPSSIERSRSRVDRSSAQRPSFPDRSSSRVDRGSSIGRGNDSPSRSGSRLGSSAPSRAPNFPSASSRSAPSVRSAPQRAPSPPAMSSPRGGGGVRSAPSRPSGGGGGGVRSAPSRGRSGSRER